jgi:FtsZ-binding cell division protein ZapB
MGNIDLLSLGLGVVLGVVLYAIKSFISTSALKKELKEYKDHLQRQMKLTQDGTKKLEEENEKLKSENENLRISVKTLSQKPGRNEIRLLNIYDLAIRKMNAKAPGFAQGWELSMQEAEKEYEERESGIKGAIKRVFAPSITHNKDIDTSSE